MSSLPTYNQSVHRTAVLTAVFALLPITVGALVTTTRAGMAFLDWPTSDGHNMILYPWLMSAGDKFVEHGHRLAGMAIGLASIVLAVVLWRRETRGWVKTLGIAGLVGVVAQGLLGGLRVIENDQSIAMIHGSFAAIVFCTFGAVALVTGRSWLESRDREAELHSLKPVAVLLPCLILGQYVLGGVIRHLGHGLHEHLGMAFLVLAFTAYCCIRSRKSSTTWVASSGTLLLAIVVSQVALGLATWVMKFGFATIGYVAIADSWQQVSIRTVHTVFGMIVLLTSVLHAMRIFRSAGIRDVTWQRLGAPSLNGGA